jgi:hypothetical protein
MQLITVKVDLPTKDILDKMKSYLKDFAENVRTHGNPIEAISFEVSNVTSTRLIAQIGYNLGALSLSTNIVNTRMVPGYIILKNGNVITFKASTVIRAKTNGEYYYVFIKEQECQTWVESLKQYVPINEVLCSEVVASFIPSITQ